MYIKSCDTEVHPKEDKSLKWLEGYETNRCRFFKEPNSYEEA